MKEEDRNNQSLHFHDVENLVTPDIGEDDGKINKKLSMKFSYTKGECGHKITDRELPRLFQLDSPFSIASTPCLVVFSVVLGKCLESRDCYETTILCESMKQVEAVRYSLKRMNKDKDPVLKISYFNETN